MVGSSYYVSPECLKGAYSYPTDLWSAGIIIYIMLSGLPPFNGANTREVFRSIVNQPLNLDCDPWQVQPRCPWFFPGMLFSQFATEKKAHCWAQMH